MIMMVVTERYLAAVALYTSAWIEIWPVVPKRRHKLVALYTSAWIEIPKNADHHPR